MIDLYFCMNWYIKFVIIKEWKSEIEKKGEKRRREERWERERERGVGGGREKDGKVEFKVER